MTAEKRFSKCAVIRNNCGKSWHFPVVTVAAQLIFHAIVNVQMCESEIETIFNEALAKIKLIESHFDLISTWRVQWYGVRFDCSKVKCSQTLNQKSELVCHKIVFMHLMWVQVCGIVYTNTRIINISAFIQIFSM